MKIRFFPLMVVFLGLLAAPAAQAQLEIPAARAESQKPELSGPMTVAMTYYRFSAQSPDFSAWALLTDEYLKAEEYAKYTVQSRVAKRIEQDFSLIAVGDQLVVDVPVTLSDYSLENKGYLVENFTPDMSFPFVYSGENFAVVPDNIFDHQWLAADGLPAKLIDDLRKTSANGKDAVLTLFLLPKFASKETVDVDGKPTRLVAVDIGGMSFFDKDGQLIWHEKQTAPGTPVDADEKKQELIRLYQ